MPDDQDRTPEYDQAPETRTHEDGPPDPFDPESLKLGQNFGATLGVKKVLTRVPVRKPNKHEFVRVHADTSYQLETAMIEDKMEREYYLVAPTMWNDIGIDVDPTCLWFAVNRNGDVFLWPTKLPARDGRSMGWHESARDAARLAQDKWLRVASNMAAGMYDVFEANGNLPDPSWPEITFPEVLKLAFKDRMIQDHDHPFLAGLRGEV